MRIILYTFEDRDGNEFGSFSTQDYEAAKRYASRYGLRVIANNFEFVDAERLDDYTKADDPFEEDEDERDDD